MDPVTRQPFLNNIIPTNRIDPISAGLAKYYEAPNNPSGTVQNYVANLSSEDDGDSFLFRVDHRFSSKHDFMSRYALQDREIYTPGTFIRVGGLAIPQRFQNIVLGLTSTLTPNLLNEARFSYGRTVNRQQGQNTGNPIAADLGIPFAPRDPFNAGFPEGIGLGTTAISGIGEGNPWFLTVNSFQWMTASPGLEELTPSRPAPIFGVCALMRFSRLAKTIPTRLMASSLETASPTFFSGFLLRPAWL
jgi:hypothetical protein